MYIRFLRRCISLALLGSVAGCATQNVSNPGDITLEHALVDTVKALAAAQREGKAIHSNFGFYGCTVTAVFNVAATAGQENKLSLTAAGPPVAILPVTLGGSGSFDSTASGTRSNTVTVVLATKPCMAKASGDGKAPNQTVNLKDPGPIYMMVP